MNDLIDSILSMKLDIYRQYQSQDANTGAIKREWKYFKTLPCHAKGIVSNSVTNRSGDKQVFSNVYVNDASTLVVPIAHPVMTSNNDRQLELKSWF